MRPEPAVAAARPGSRQRLRLRTIPGRPRAPDRTAPPGRLLLVGGLGRQVRDVGGREALPAAPALASAFCPRQLTTKSALSCGMDSHGLSVSLVLLVLLIFGSNWVLFDTNLVLKDPGAMLLHPPDEG